MDLTSPLPAVLHFALGLYDIGTKGATLETCLHTLDPNVVSLFYYSVRHAWTKGMPRMSISRNPALTSYSSLTDQEASANLQSQDIEGPQIQVHRRSHIFMEETKTEREILPDLFAYPLSRSLLKELKCQAGIQISSLQYCQI